MLGIILHSEAGDHSTKDVVSTQGSFLAGCLKFILHSSDTIETQRGIRATLGDFRKSRSLFEGSHSKDYSIWGSISGSPFF